MGAVLYEKPNSREVTLNWYSTTLMTGKKDRLEYPQEPLQQGWIVDYPMLAYKCMAPDNKEIALVHLAQEIP